MFTINLTYKTFRELILRQFRTIGSHCKEGKAIREGPWGCETSRLPHLLDDRLIDGGKAVSLTCRPPFTPQEDSWYSFLLEAK
jgi:hypothetical protein